MARQQIMKRASKNCRASPTHIRSGGQRARDEFGWNSATFRFWIPFDPPTIEASRVPHLPDLAFRPAADWPQSRRRDVESRIDYPWF